MTEYTAAQAADPTTSPADLAQIVSTRPDLRAIVAANPACYPELLEWLSSLGDPMVNEAIVRRRTTQPVAPVYAQPVQQAGYVAMPQPGTYSAAVPDGYQPRSRTTAGILGILLGGLGVHRFYMGYVGIGIAQIAVTIVTFGLGGLWGVIEGILILVGSSLQVDAKGVPLIR